MSRSSRIPGFYRLSVAERRRRLAELCRLDPSDLAPLDSGGIDQATADGMIENAIGRFALPLGVALNMRVDDTDYLVPMAIEEPSVVAAASNAARMVRCGGGFYAEVSPPVMIGQVQLTDLADPDRAVAALAAAEADILSRARALVPGLVARGGGPVGPEARVLSRAGSPDGGMVVVHLLVDCRDAMGANLVNSIAEGIAEPIARVAGGRVGLRILSNLAVHRTVTVRAEVPEAALAGDDLDGARAADAIAAASRFAELDPYRAATHNKGIMNGLDAVLIATGQDWRGAEAGAHAYAAQGGQYRPLCTWRRAAVGLTGELTLPLAVGTVGGALHVHAGARLALAMLAVGSAQELAAVAAATGMASNLAALRALGGAGIQRGHMALHARVVARAAGASGDLLERVAAEIAALGDVKPERAREILSRLRREIDGGALTLSLEGTRGVSSRELVSVPGGDLPGEECPS
ncbi:MAG TPA: hydroxymethylglutaryl-CoA reductase, degradative [Kofleriaceae bacterium]|nr:hydroxymethylglutaryl-CoA reductase, degradative [Kofleriaceae bacterium]